MKFIFYFICFFTLSNSFGYEYSYNTFSVAFPKAEIINEYTARIPLKKFGQLIVIEARTMGKTGNFIIDTGSESMILNAVHFSANPRRKQLDSFGIDGKIDNVLSRQLESFSINGLVLDKKTSHVIDLSHIENAKKMKLLGIIGYNYLKNYEIFIDLYLNQITLSKVDLNGEKYDDKVYLEQLVDSIPFQLRKHSIVLKKNLNKKQYLFCLDSGAEYNQVNSRFIRKNQDMFKPTRKLSLSGAKGIKDEVVLGLLYEFMLGTQQFKPMHTMLTNLWYSQEAFGVRVDGVLGYEFFKQKRTIINYRKEMLYFVKYPDQL